MAEDFKNTFDRISEMMLRQQAEHSDKLGWSELEDDDLIWDKFCKIYKFRPSVRSEDWPGILEPKISRTFSIDHIYEPDFDRLTHELSDYYSACFKNIVPKGKSIIVLDWQHSCFTFDPHAGFEFESMEDWPIPPLPNGDYYIFLTEDLSGGFFGHPWEQTICVIGEAFVQSLKYAPRDVFCNLVRLDGVKIR